jgi:hypothetical protein
MTNTQQSNVFYGYSKGEWDYWEWHNPNGFDDCIKVVSMYIAMRRDSDFKDGMGHSVLCTVFDVCHAMRWLEGTLFEFENTKFDELYSLYLEMYYSPVMVDTRVPDKDEESGAYDTLLGLLCDEGLDDVEYLIDMGYIDLGLRERDVRYTSMSEFQCTTEFYTRMAALQDEQHLILDGQTERLDRVQAAACNCDDGTLLMEQYNDTLKVMQQMNNEEEIPDGEWDKLMSEMDTSLASNLRFLCRRDNLAYAPYNDKGMIEHYGGKYTVSGYRI